MPTFILASPVSWHVQPNLSIFSFVQRRVYPDCEQFVQTQLVPHLLQLTRSWSHGFADGFLRQRSSSERRNCRLPTWRVRDANIYELCAICMNPDPKDYLPFLDCLTRVHGTTRHELDPQLSEKLSWQLLVVVRHLWRKSCSFVRKLIQAAAAATLDDHKESRCLRVLTHGRRTAGHGNLRARKAFSGLDRILCAAIARSLLYYTRGLVLSSRCVEFSVCL